MMKLALKAFSRLWWTFENKTQQRTWVRIIYRDGKPLITRYYLFSTRWIEDSEWMQQHPRLQRCLKPFSQRLVIHNAHESDEDGHHDHPWPWGSWILQTGYSESTPEGLFWRGPGHLRFRPARAFHRLILDPSHQQQGKGVWSLFWMGPREKEWGFLAGSDGKTWVPWYKHNRALDPTAPASETMREAP
jgi:hypothetical protein